MGSSGHLPSAKQSHIIDAGLSVITFGSSSNKNQLTNGIKIILRNKLLVIESKHQAYFKINNISILDAVKIIGGFKASVHVINNSIP